MTGPLCDCMLFEIWEVVGVRGFRVVIPMGECRCGGLGIEGMGMG